MYTINLFVTTKAFLEKLFIVIFFSIILLYIDVFSLKIILFSFLSPHKHETHKICIYNLSHFH